SCRAQNIVAVDTRRRRQRPRHLSARANALIEHGAAFRREPFGIVETARNVVGIENDGGGHYWAGERSPPRFVATGDRPYASLERCALAPEGRPGDYLFYERQTRRDVLAGVLDLAGSSAGTMVAILAIHSGHDGQARGRGAMWYFRLNRSPCLCFHR